MNARIRRITTAAGLLGALWGSVSCGDVVRQGRSPAYLVIDTMTAASGAKPGEFGTPLLSDVQTLVKVTIGGVEQQVPTFYNDLGQATLRVQLKDQGNPGAPSTVSPTNYITITQYHVAFKRSDGLSKEGVDVPYAFDGGVTATITPSASNIGFEIVRHQAKEEAPLRALIGGGGRITVSTIAEVTFYGHDQAGNEVQVVGTISINFADFADPQ